MTFQPPIDSKNNNFTIQPFSTDNVNTLIPSIYTNQNKHITSTEWGDKAANWVKAKRNNEAMWNTFGISPAPEAPIIPEPSSIFSIQPSEIVHSPLPPAVEPEILPPLELDINIPLPDTVVTTKESEEVFKSKKKHIPNWIKSVQTSSKHKTKRENCDTTLGDNSKHIIIKNNVASQYNQGKIAALARELSKNILYVTTTTIVAKLSENAIKQLDESLRSGKNSLDDNSSHSNKSRKTDNYRKGHSTSRNRSRNSSDSHSSSTSDDYYHQKFKRKYSSRSYKSTKSRSHKKSKYTYNSESESSSTPRRNNVSRN